MRTIHKLILPLQDEIEVQWPEVSEPLHVGVQNGLLTVWYSCHTELDMTTAKFYIRGTGQPWPSPTEYIGTVQMPPFVWHVFLDVEQR